MTQLRAAAATGQKAFADAQAVVQDEAQRTELDQAQKSFEEYAKLTIESAATVMRGEAIYTKTIVPQMLAMQQRLGEAEAALGTDFGNTKSATLSRARRRGAVAGDVRRDRPGARSRARLRDRPEHRVAAHRDDRSSAPARRRRQGGRDPGARRPR